MAQAETLLYVSEATDQRIVVANLDAASGKLQGIQEVETKSAPGSLAVDPAKKFLFASLRTTNSLASFRIADSGKLEPVSTVSLHANANATYVATDAAGKFLFSASYHGGRVAVNGIDASGKLSESLLQTITTVRTAHAAVISPDQRWVFVPHVEPNAIYQFRLEASSGKLTEQGKAPGGAEGAGPRHLAFHPSQKFAFSSNETGSSVTLYAYDAEAGLKPLQTLSTLPDGFDAKKNTCADVKVHRNGKLVWVSNRGHDSLAGFKFDEAGVKLTSLGQTPTEKTPRSFDLSPSGDFAFGAGEGSGRLAVYRIDQESGKLEPLGTHALGKSLTWVLSVER